MFAAVSSAVVTLCALATGGWLTAPAPASMHPLPFMVSRSLFTVPMRQLFPLTMTVPAGALTFPCTNEPPLIVNPPPESCSCNQEDWFVVPRIPLACLLYTSDAADERSSVDLGG